MDTARERLRVGLRTIRRRWLLYVWLRVAALWLFATAAAFVCAATLVVLVRPTGLPLAAVTLAVPAFSAAALAALSWAWWRRPTDQQVARYAEERCPDLEERLISATDVLTEDTPGPMHHLVLASGVGILEQLGAERILPGRKLASRSVAAVAGLAAAVAAGLVFAPHAGRGWQTARATLFPSTVSLNVEPGDTRVVEGGALALRVRVDGVSPDAWVSPVTMVSTAPHLRDTPPLPLRDGVFSADLPAGEHSFSYRIVSGVLVSPEYRVTVRRQPRVERIAVRYEYPRFSGLQPRVDEEGGDIFAPAGTKVTVQVHTATPVASGALDLTGKPVGLEARSPRLLEGQFVVDADAAYRVTLDDGEGLTSDGDTEYFVRVMDDSPPDVRIMRPGGDARVTRLEEVVVQARADDDYGLSRFELVFAPQGGRQRVVPLAHGGGTSATGQHTIYIEDLDVRPGDFITYYARARDIGRGKPSVETRSDIFFLEVRPFNEEFEAAQSQAGMSGGEDGNFDDLARLQKDIIVATWRLDRRRAGGAGRSAQDVRTIAKSQADVKARAAQLAARLVAPPPRSRTRPGQAPAPPPVPLPLVPGTPTPATPAPMQRAVEAMGRAQVSLEQLDTTAALPHENTALNELLRAQAEVRRRQVAQQSSSSRGRGGRSGNQDLSALFDRELQRQQQTNYEQRATTESREETKEDETLRRLRELAARQDELNREQRELARRRSQLTVEEMKRRLERLTRDQEELRRQAEDLARRMQQSEQSAQGQRGQQGRQNRQGQEGQPGQQADSSGTSAGAQGAQADTGEQQPSDAQRLREAAGDMAAAAGELQRESPGAASDRSQRALERLRAAADGAEGAKPDDRRRIAGDLEAEARQLAEAARRLADQADAAGKTGDKESVSRLAAQQGRLAERADALERGARRLADQVQRPNSTKNGSTAAGERAATDAARRAARDLQAERVGERLRQGAQTARESAGGGSPTDAGRQLSASSRGVAQPLERVADSLGQVAGKDAESRRLSDALDRARRLRQELASADREAPRAGQQQGAGSPGSSGRDQSGQSRGESRQSESGSRGSEGGRGGGQSGDAEARAQAEFVRQLRQQRDLLDALQRENPQLGARMQALEGWAPSASAPGTEPWKQDRAKWDALKKDVTLALERYESSAAARLAAREARQRLDAGSDVAPPDAWRQDVADYFKAISGKPRQ